MENLKPGETPAHPRSGCGTLQEMDDDSLIPHKASPVVVLSNHFSSAAGVCP